MDRSERLRRVERLAGLMRDLPADRAGRVTLVLLGNALATGVLQVALGVVALRTLRRAWRVRSEGGRAVARVVLDRSTAGAAAALVVHGIARRRLFAWLERQDRG